MRKKAFRVNQSCAQTLRNRKARIKRRLKPRNWSDQPKPMLGAGNIACNSMVGGQCLEDLERLRQDESHLNGLGARRMPDPATAGDFPRRFQNQHCDILQDCINRTREKAWQLQPRNFLPEAFLDVDGTIATTTAECKDGIGLSYKGTWGYSPLVVSLGNTKEVLFTVNRPGNENSQKGSVPWIDRALELVAPMPAN